MALNVHQLHIFYTVAERGSFSAAAQALHMTQPAVTMQVQALEERFGTKLLNRTTKKLELTEAGHRLLPQARKAVELMRDTDEMMVAYIEELKGRLQFAASLTIGEYVLPSLLGPFLRRFPDVTVDMKVMNTTEIVDAVAHQGLEFGIIEAPCEVPGLEVQTVMDDELLLITPTDHPFASRDEVTLEEFMREPMVLREKGSGTRMIMEEELRRHGVSEAELRVVSEFGSTGAVKSAVEAGLGLSLLSIWTIKHELALGLLKPVKISGVNFRRQFYAVWLQSSLLSIPATALLQDLRGLSHDR
ncbi:LysR family transcriptional regulator [Cohnella cholangitidis]|uniref:LysR family transcriptional regulator n=1 Tax=Cohnella cholangitidis TaxID=2598458 RepID=A0A7G5BTJ2_9BACL|nr:LysR family transcriptional regulator [Cohnella cholangitidis]QMV40276.1 LysR family transcriptional regulator [Cohnella cholangitidis]